MQLASGYPSDAASTAHQFDVGRESPELPLDKLPTSRGNKRRILSAMDNVAYNIHISSTTTAAEGEAMALICCPECGRVVSCITPGATRYRTDALKQKRTVAPVVLG